MRIMSDNAITRDEITKTLSDMDIKQNRQIRLLASLSVSALIMSVLSLMIIFLK